MKTSNAGIEFIKSFEGLRLKAYLCSAGVPTLGFGSTTGIKLGMTCTEAEAEAMLRRDLETFEDAVERAVTAPLNPNQHAALVSLAYNIGSTAFTKSTLVKRLNAFDPDGAAEQFARWNKAGGKVLAGLTRRRAAEAELFRTKAKTSVPTVAQTVPPDAPKKGLFSRLFGR